MQESQIYEQLTAIFREVLVREDIELRPELTAKDVPGWDSFKQIEIVLAVEAKYGIKLRTREVDALDNVAALVRIILAKTASI
jgi:acyl carrier protein